MRIGLVGCVKGKRSSAAPARDLYTSSLFLGRRSHVERTCEEWVVLSALHGVVGPGHVLEPYDVTLNDASIPERRAWSAQVVRQLEERLGPLGDHTFELHAGRNYWGFGLRDALVGAGATVENPTEGLRMGEQLRFYSGPR